MHLLTREPYDEKEALYQHEYCACVLDGENISAFFL